MTQEAIPHSFPRPFLDLVKQVLEHLYDYPYLQRHPLALSPAFRPAQPGQNAAYLLRQAFIDAIERLNPGEGVYFRAPQARLYSLMHLHYVEGMMVQEASHDLGISERQAYRDLRQGEVTIASILWAELRDVLAYLAPQTTPDLVQTMAGSTIPEEISRLTPQPEPTNIANLISSVMQLVDPLANQLQVHLTSEGLTESIICSVDQAVARQVLVNLLSRVIRSSSTGENVLIRLIQNSGETLISIQFLSPGKEVIAGLISPVANSLLEQLDWTVSLQPQQGSQMTLSLGITRREKVLLVIDDNEGLVDLLDRLLSSEPIRLVPAHTGAQGIQMASELHPNAILLDVMMAGMDGWEALQRLKNEPATAQIPVIICSVFNDPDLAFSLGAKIFLSKPITPPILFQALRQAGLV